MSSSTTNPAQPDLPPRTEVAVVGTGVAALTVTEALASTGAAPLWLADARDVRQSSPSLGVCRVGPTMHLARLAAGHGETRAADCVRAGLSNRKLLEQFGADCGVTVRRQGSLRFASGAEEAAEVERSVRLLQRLDRPARFAAVNAFVADAPARFTHAAVHADDATVDMAALEAALMRRVEASATRVVRDVRVQRIEDDHEVRLHTSRGIVRAEVTIVAAEELLAPLVAFCRFKIVPMRTQALTASAPARAEETPASPSSEPTAWSAVHGYESWSHHDAARQVHVSGSRSLPVKKELGARRGTTAAVQALLDSNLAEFGRFRSYRVERRWSAVQGVSCDGLPLVGAIPGRARLLVCGGFGVNDVGWAFVAARTLADLLARGRAEHHGVLSPRRFL